MFFKRKKVIDPLLVAASKKGFHESSPVELAHRPGNLGVIVGFCGTVENPIAEVDWVKGVFVPPGLGAQRINMRLEDLARY